MSSDPAPAADKSSYPWAKRGAARGKSKDTAMCCAFSNDDSMLLVGFYDGVFAVFDMHTLGTRYETTIQHGAKPSAVTAIAVRPAHAGKPAYLVATTHGQLDRLDGAFAVIDSITEPENEIYSVDYNPSGTYFATCGQDATVRVYRESSSQVVREVRLAPQYSANVAALRLFSVRFDPDHGERFFTGGWGNTVHEHTVVPATDAEHEHVEFFGAYITGEALDVAKGQLVSASHRLQDQLQTWDLDTRKPTTLPWPVKHRFLPAAARLSPDGQFFAVGGSGGTGLEAGFFVLELGSGGVVVDQKVEKAVTAVAFAKREALVAFCDAEGQVQVYENRFAHRS